MENPEQKLLTAKVELYRNLRTIDNSIFYQITNGAENLLNKMPTITKWHPEETETIEVPMEEIKLLKDFLHIISNEDRFGNLTSYFQESYIIPKQEQLKILNLL